MNNNLEEEAKILSNIFLEWYNLLSNKQLTEYDFCGLFILAYLSIRKKKKWFGGYFPVPLLNSYEYISIKLKDIPYIIDLLDENYLKKLFPGQYDNLTVISIFSSIRFSGIKKNVDNFINKSIVYWAINKRPFILLTYIPTPIQVLQMQAIGQRVATIFLKYEELSTYHMAKLYYMDGQQNHSKDAFEFFIHDLKHMENFIDDATYSEQVGFFYSFLHLSDQSPKKYLKKLISDHSYNMINSFLTIISISSHDFQVHSELINNIININFKQLWNELEYLISDMNCYLPHLMKYLIAKLSINCQILYQQIWINILQLLENTFQDKSNELIIISSFECYLRSIWIDLMKSLHIISPLLTNTIDTLQPLFEIHPYNASISMLNHSIKHSHIEEKININNLNSINFQCICGKCEEDRYIELTLQEEGESLRLHFQQIRFLKENNISDSNSNSNSDIPKDTIINTTISTTNSKIVDSNVKLKIIELDS